MGNPGYRERPKERQMPDKDGKPLEGEPGYEAPPTGDLRGDKPEPDPPTLEEQLAAEKTKREELEKELHTAKSSLGNARKTAADAEAFEGLRDEMRHTRLLAEAGRRNLTDEQTVDYIRQSESKARMAAEFRGITDRMDENIQAAGLTTDDPRLQAAWDAFETARDNPGGIDIGSALRAQRLVDDVVREETATQHEAAVTKARGEGIENAKRLMDEDGDLNTAPVGGGTAPKQKAKTSAEFWTRYNAGQASEEEAQKWLP